MSSDSKSEIKHPDPSSSSSSSSRSGGSISGLSSLSSFATAAAATLVEDDGHFLGPMLLQKKRLISAEMAQLMEIDTFWSCSKCTYENKMSALVCDICRNKKTSSSPPIVHNKMTPSERRAAVVAASCQSNSPIFQYITMSPRAALEGKNIILVYAAGWCTHSIRIMPQLEEWCQHGGRERYNAEIVYVPCDHNRDDFNQFFQQMPMSWYSLPYDVDPASHVTTDSESNLYRLTTGDISVTKIPSITVFASNGSLINYDAAPEVANGDVEYPWMPVGILYRVYGRDAILSSSSSSTAAATTTSFSSSLSSSSRSSSTAAATTTSFSSSTPASSSTAASSATATTTTATTASSFSSSTSASSPSTAAATTSTAAPSPTATLSSFSSSSSTSAASTSATPSLSSSSSTPAGSERVTETTSSSSSSSTPTTTSASTPSILSSSSTQTSSSSSSSPSSATPATAIASAPSSVPSLSSSSSSATAATTTTTTSLFSSSHGAPLGSSQASQAIGGSSSSRSCVSSSSSSSFSSSSSSSSAVSSVSVERVLAKGLTESKITQKRKLVVYVVDFQVLHNPMRKLEVNDILLQIAECYRQHASEFDVIIVLANTTTPLTVPLSASTSTTDATVTETRKSDTRKLLESLMTRFDWTCMQPTDARLRYFKGKLDRQYLTIYLIDVQKNELIITEDQSKDLIHRFFMFPRHMALSPPPPPTDTPGSLLTQLQ